jgi:hypothetical protein
MVACWYVTDFNGVMVVQNYLSRTGREEWARQVNHLNLGFFHLLLTFRNP